MTDMFIDTLSVVWKSYQEGLTAFLPGFLALAILFFSGWVLAKILNWSVCRALRMAGFDRYCGNSGLTHLLNRADIKIPPRILAGKLVFWIVFLFIVFFGLNALGLEVFREMTSKIFLYLPNLIMALFILILGMLIGAFLSRAALLTAVNRNFPSPRIIGSIVKYTIFILAFAMALEELKIAGNIVTAAFSIAFGSVMLSLAIAFGLGGRDVARRIIEERIEKKKEVEEDDFHHL